jgi:hypothetical protein
MKMPPPKVVVPEINDPEFHATDTVRQAVSGFSGSLNRGDYVGTAVWMLAVGITSAKAYYEASQKFGWTLTKANRNLRYLNAALPSVLDEGGFLPNKGFWDELERNKVEAQDDRSYLVEPTSDRNVHLTVALQRTGMEDDSRNAKESGNRKAAKIYKEFGKLLISLLYEEDPAAAADNYADDLEKMELPTKSGIVFNRFKIPVYQPAASEEVLEARRNVVSRYRETAASLRNEQSEPDFTVGTRAELDVKRSKTVSGTYYNIV